MKYKLPILTVGLAIVLLACYSLLGPQKLELLSVVVPGDGASNRGAGPPQAADFAITDQSPSVLPAEVGSTASLSASGQGLVQQAIKELVKQECLQAEIRQQVDLYGHHLVGVGRYRQFFVAGQRHLKLELKLQVDHQVSSMSQVSDGRHFWTRLDLPHETSLSRIDLRRVQETVAQQSLTDPVAQSSMWMALGGLPKLLQGLESHFKFSRPQAAQWQEKSVWVTEGTWKPALVEHYWESHRSMPEYVPGRVQLVLARDPNIRLFPYRIRFWKSDGVEEKDVVSEKPMMTIEFADITHPSFFTKKMFQYQRGDQVVIDRTDTFLKHLRNPPWSFVDGTSP